MVNSLGRVELESLGKLDRRQHDLTSFLSS